LYLLRCVVAGTKSNEWSGKRTFGGRSLHEIDDPAARNPYEDVIETIGRTLKDFGSC
jgi:E3 ubiquitin-protein ligase RGLG